MSLYEKLGADLTGRCKESRKVGNNTWKVRRGDDAIAIRYHATDVLTAYADGRIVLNTDGWKTLTTKERINAWLPSPWVLFTQSGVWFIVSGGWNKLPKTPSGYTTSSIKRLIAAPDVYLYHDGLTIDENLGIVINPVDDPDYQAFLCKSCGEPIIKANDQSALGRGPLHKDCAEMEDEYATALLHYRPHHSVEHIRFSDCYLGVYQRSHPLYGTRICAPADDRQRALVEEFSTTFHHTDAWRGHTDTDSSSWLRIADGWMTGYPDDTVPQKFDLIEFGEFIQGHAHEVPCEVVILIGITSNVFSQTMDVYVRSQEDADRLEAWMQADRIGGGLHMSIDDLNRALS